MGRLADVDIRLLRVFRAVVDSGGFSSAQSVLGTSTSTISLHMTELEKRLGFRLCQRGRAGFALTDRGYLTFQQVKLTLNMLDAHFDSIVSLRKRLVGKIRLGIVDSLITHPHSPLTEALRKFNRLENEVEMQVLVDERSELERRVLARDLQAAISPFVRPVAGLVFHRLFIERHRPYCGLDHPLFGQTSTMTRAELASHPFILRSHLGRADEDRFPDMNVRATANNMEAMLTLVLTGNYLGLLPDHLAETWEQKGQLWALAVPELEQVSHHALVLPRSLDVSTATATLAPLILAEVDATAFRDEPRPLPMRQAIKYQP